MRRAGIVFTALLIASSIACASGSSPSTSTEPVAPTTTPTPTAAPTSTSTPSPSSAIAARYPDGIPSSLGGEPVLRGAAVLAMARSMTTADPFLVGTWLDVYTGPRSCPIPTRSLPPDSWLDNCQPGVRPSDQAGSGTSVLRAADTATFLFAEDLRSGPAILRVHVHDPRAIQCGPDESICDRMMVVESAVWTGDAATDPHPISIHTALAAVDQAAPGTSLRLLADGEMRSYAGELTSGRTLQPPYRSLDPNSADALVLSTSVLPSVEAMRRALPKVTPGVTGALMPSAVDGTWGVSDPTHSWSFKTRWFVVENVAVLVNTTPAPSAADRALLGRLADALSALAASPSPH